jgi:biotin carboxyl carrier protein
VLGPQQDRFTGAGVKTFLCHIFEVSAKSNRQGIRLHGPPIEHVRGADLVSEGIAHGAVQVPGDGHPIVLLASRQTVGGYVKIATVAGADLDGLGQLRPGDRIRFTEVEVHEARAAMLTYRERTGPGAIVQTPHLHSGWAPVLVPTAEEIERVAGTWDPDGVVRVIEALERAGATSFAIEVAGLKLELKRAENGPVTPESQASSADVCARAEPGSERTVTAPVLGVFYRRSAPDQPPLAEEGQTVESGQVICVLEVMKSYHEVVAPESGFLTEFLVEDGQFVEYGQPIARISKGGN